MSRATEHTCHADNCTTHVPPRMFMCKHHWYMLTKAERDSLWAVYVPGQERRMDPSDEYIDTAFHLIDLVRERELAKDGTP